LKAFSRLTCPWRKPETALVQLEDMYKFRQNSSAEMKGRFLGIVSTAWSGAGDFLKEFYETEPAENEPKFSVPETFKAVFPK
jgi:hypothetical protein